MVEFYQFLRIMITLISRSTFTVPFKVRWFMRALRANHYVFSVYRVDFDYLPHAYWIVLSFSKIDNIVLSLSSLLSVPIFPFKFFEDNEELDDYITDLVNKLPAKLYQ